MESAVLLHELREARVTVPAHACPRVRRLHCLHNCALNRSAKSRHGTGACEKSQVSASVGSSNSAYSATEIPIRSTAIYTHRQAYRFPQKTRMQKKHTVNVYAALI